MRATSNGVFPMPASVWAGNHPDRLPAPSALPPGPPSRHDPGLPFYRELPVAPIFRRIRPLFKTRLKGLDGPARKAAALRKIAPRAGLMFRAVVGAPGPALPARHAGGPLVSRSCRGVGRVVADRAPDRLTELIPVNSERAIGLVFRSGTADL